MRLTVVQFRPDFADAGANSARIEQGILEAAAQGADLVVYPEAAITGYCFQSADEARAASVETSSGPVDRIRKACEGAKVHAIVGYAERTGDALFNSAAFFGPRGLIGVYRKTHLPCLGLDRFVKRGDALKVFDTAIGKIGVLICFDNRFPEPARVLSLRGAELICLPTNWPESAERNSDFICATRAMENHIFFAAANRVGEENEFQFVGRSKIIGPDGTVLAAADHTKEDVISADLDLASAREKRVVQKAGEYELDLFGERRPALYREISD
ncbi:MAG: carbon-nitrogen hydrolase family protein [Armatimonadetes bacterium]|nr:carbon-nitrogen hydrolase family protein [Armatimonadota bacterium]